MDRIKKRRQHFVWKHYLGAWATDGTLFCDHDGRRFPASPANVAHTRDFYRVERLTRADIAYTYLIAQGLPAPAAQVCESLLRVFTIPQEAADLYAALPGRDPAFEALHDAWTNNLEEEIHANFEAKALPILAALKQRDATPVFDEQLGMSTAMFLGLQYMRTPGMSRRITSRSFAELPGFNIDAAWGVLRCIWAAVLAGAIYKQQDNAHVAFLEAGTGTGFIASDQPIVNMRIQPDGSSREMELYYPLSPSLAMLLSVDAARPRTSVRRLPDRETHQYNVRLASHRHHQLYAAAVADLEKLSTTSSSGD